MTEITVKDVEAATPVRAMHLDGSDHKGRWSANIFRLVEHPRLRVMKKSWMRRGVPPATVWLVDGKEIGALEDALAALNAGPLPDVTPVELAALLAAVEDDWTEQQGNMPIHLMPLTEKALIEWREQPGTKTHCRRTDLGREVLAAHYKVGESSDVG